MSRKLTRAEFVEKATKVHHSKYDYSKVEYINSSTKVCIICPEHGEFYQRPQDHLKGYGCSRCKYVVVSQKMSKWSESKVYETSKKYNSLKAFRENEYACYCYARKNGLIKNMAWLKRAYKEINKANTIEESKKYTSRGDFCNGSHSHYAYARRHNLLEEMPWLKPKTNNHKEAHCIYAYFDHDNKVFYVGQTMRPKERDKEHRENEKSSVYAYFKGINKDIPAPIYLEGNLQDKQAQVKEDFWLNYYIEKGYKALNRAKTGYGCGSLGLCRIKWTKEKIFKEARKYNSSSEFRLKNSSAYQIACRKKWIVEIAEECGWKIRIKWNKEKCLYYAKQCSGCKEFKKRYQSGYKFACKNKILKELQWKAN